MIKVGIFSPYLDILGGGEKYLLSIAEALSSRADVVIYADPHIKEKSLTRFNISLKRVQFLPADAIRTQNVFKRYSYLSRYDIFFYMTDGSIFFSGAKKNFLIIQSPLHIPSTTLPNKLKLVNWQILCYSQFMQDIIRRKMPGFARISSLAPCVTVPGDDKLVVEKENIILSVGRFFPYPHDKKHEMMVDLFRANHKKYFSGWKLIIAGGLTEEGGRQILQKLKDKSRGIPVEIMVDLPSYKLEKLYKRAKIYWHAAGFGEDLALYPERAEHFGIAPLEAMANGAVPLLFSGGGLRDITGNNDDFLWRGENELLAKTYDLIQNAPMLAQKAKKAYKMSKAFSCDKFYAKLEKIIAG